jgi:hypothetical protein
MASGDAFVFISPAVSDHTAAAALNGSRVSRIGGGGG